MAATVKVLVSGTRKHVINVTGAFDVSDGSADITNQVLVNRSDFFDEHGAMCQQVRVDEVTWVIGGYDYVVVDWDDATDEVVEYYRGPGYMDYRPYGGKTMSAATTTDTEGDLQMSTAGGAAGDSYSLTISCILKY